MVKEANKKRLIALLLLPVGYLVGLTIIAIVESPDASLAAATNPIYMMGVLIGVSAFAIGFLR